MDVKFTNVLVVLCAILSAVSIVSVGYLMTADDTDEGTDVRYTLYIGMADRPAGDITEVEDHMKTLITGFGYGYTLEEECGGYVVGDQVFTDDTTLKYIIISADYQNIVSIINTIKADHGISAVFLEQSTIKAGFL